MSLQNPQTATGLERFPNKIDSLLLGEHLVCALTLFDPPGCTRTCWGKLNGRWITVIHIDQMSRNDRLSFNIVWNRKPDPVKQGRLGQVEKVEQRGKSRTARFRFTAFPL